MMHLQVRCDWGDMTESDALTGDAAAGDAVTAADPVPVTVPGDPATLSQQAYLAIVVMLLLVGVSLVMFVGTLVETVILWGDPGPSVLFDFVIRVASGEGSTQLALAFASVLVVLLSFLFSARFPPRLWWTVALCTVASLVSAAALFLYTDSTFYPETFTGFEHVSATAVVPNAESFDPDAIGNAMDPMYAALRKLIVFGGLWNCFVLLSLLRNKVATDFLKRVIGIEL